MVAARPDGLNRVVRLAAGDPSARFGCYLHGSWSRGEARPDSDIDVLVIAADDTSERQREHLRATCLESVGVDRLDLKVLPAGEIAADPWVDVHRAVWLGGYRWHDELPVPTPDQAGRESLMVLRVLIEDAAFDADTPDALRKPVARLCSVLAALLGPVVPRSGTEAITILRTHQADPVVFQVLTVVEALSSPAPVPDLTDRVRQALDGVLTVLSRRLDDGELGPVCAEAATIVLAACPSR